MLIKSSESCRFTLRAGPDGVLLAGGELDLAAVDDLRDCLADPTVVAVDLAAVTFIESCVLGALVVAHQERVGGLTLRRPSTRVRRVLDVSGLGGYLPVDPT